jgi:hypothetical protein
MATATSTSINAPHVKHSQSSLGPSTSFFYHISLDPKETWTSNIFHNSRYLILCLRDGKLECISKGLGLPAFRKCNAVDDQQAVARINSYIAKVEASAALLND